MLPRPHVLALCTLGLAACGEQPRTVEPEAAIDPVLVIEVGSGQAGAVGDTLPLRILLRITERASGQPVVGTRIVAVNSAAMTSSFQGSTEPSVPVTDENGRASIKWTLASAPGQQTLMLTSTTGVSGSVIATAAPGPAAQISLSSLFSSLTHVLGVTGLNAVKFEIRASDRFSNTTRSALVFSSDNGGVVTLDTDSTARAHSAGLATLRIKADGAQLDVPMLVMSYDLRDYRATPVLFVSGRSTRLLGLSSTMTSIFAFENLNWVQETALAATSLYVSGSGEAWAIANGAVWRSPSRGVWDSTAFSPRDAGWIPARLYGAGASVFVGATRAPDAFGMFRRTAAGGWEDIGLPLGRYVAGTNSYPLVAVSTASDLYVSPLSGTALRWNGSAWSAVRQSGSGAEITFTALASAPDGTVLGRAADSTSFYRLGGGIAQPVTGTMTGADLGGTAIRITGITVNAGRVVGGVRDIPPPDFVIAKPPAGTGGASGWKTANDFPMAMVDADGTVWITATGQGSPGQAGTWHLLRYRAVP